MITPLDMIARIAVGATMGGVIGFERDIHGRTAGLRTHLIVAMAAATFMVVSNHFVPYQHYDGHVEADVSRIASTVVSGIGFLAGGAILRTGTSIQGLTTAAGLWLVTAIGMCCGAGMYWVGGAVTLMGLIALTVLRLFEGKDDGVLRRELSLEIHDDPAALRRVMDSVAHLGVKFADFDYEKIVSEGKLRVSFDAKIPASLQMPILIEGLERNPDVLHLRIRVPK